MMKAATDMPATYVGGKIPGARSCRWEVGEARKEVTVVNNSREPLETKNQHVMLFPLAR